MEYEHEEDDIGWLEEALLAAGATRIIEVPNEPHKRQIVGNVDFNIFVGLCMDLLCDATTIDYGEIRDIKDRQD